MSSEFFMKNMDKTKIINEIKKSYIKQIKYIGASDEKEMFSWLNNALKIYIVNIAYNSDMNIKLYRLVSFATRSDKDELEVIDLANQTSSYKYQKNSIVINVKKLLGVLLDDKLLKIPINSILQNSIYGRMPDIEDEIRESFAKDCGKNFATQEYENANNHLKKIPMNFNKETFFANKYDFKSILNKINNEQLSLELEECLSAYNKEHWFICAAGLGSVIEHIMLLTIMNYKNNNKMLSTLGKTPTAFNYINAFKEAPINIDYKQEMYIRTLFQIRNCVSHYSSGYTNKDLVDSIMNGIRNIFNEFYLNSTKQ